MARAIAYLLLLLVCRWAAEEFFVSSNTAVPALFALGALVGETLFAERKQAGPGRSIAFILCLALLTVAGLVVADRAVTSHNYSCTRAANVP